VKAWKGVLSRREHGLLAAYLPLLPLLRLPAWAVALLLSMLLEATFARLLASGRVRHSVVVVALDLFLPGGLVRPPPPDRRQLFFPFSDN
jgi:hypothetical protein